MAAQAWVCGWVYWPSDGVRCNTSRPPHKRLRKDILLLAIGLGLVVEELVRG